ncbi:hypothetical protein NDU88_004845 [Pleurodeles waltl]|uniref:Uncharacterized protein n=1 Tax=Pleurodeles waltl TaxID=8319 RepID=A0AAV7V4L1_PLEWA|nr:hypothetical protein NDU88_004845 [Pleurodeles waltl]
MECSDGGASDGRAPWGKGGRSAVTPRKSDPVETMAIGAPRRPRTMDVTKYNHIPNYIRSNVYPDYFSKMMKNGLRRLSKKFTIDGNDGSKQA